MRNKIESISAQIVRNERSDSVSLKELVSFGEFKLSIVVKSDHYHFQSRAVIEVFSKKDMAWNRVYSIHHSKMATEHGLGTSSDINPGDFSADRNALIEMAVKIL